MSTETQAVNVDTALIADDHDFTREWIAEALKESFPAITNIHDAADVKGTISKALAYRPRIVFLDINFKDDDSSDGLEAAQKIWEALPTTSIIVVSSYTSEAYVRRLYDITPETASYGYIVKDKLAKTFNEAVEAVLENDCWIAPEIIRIRARQERKGYDLSDNLYEVLACIALGLSDSTSAKLLCIVEQAVQARLRSLYQKFGIPPKGDPAAGVYNPRCRAVWHALQRGLINDSELKKWQVALQQKADDLQVKLTV